MRKTVRVTCATKREEVCVQRKKGQTGESKKRKIDNEGWKKQKFEKTLKSKTLRETQKIFYEKSKKNERSAGYLKAIRETRVW